MALLREQIASPPGVGELASMLGVNRRRLERHFRAATGKSVRAYREMIAVESAAELLRSTDLPVAEIARRCGFCSPGYLATIFRRAHGTTPAAYRGQSIREVTRGPSPWLRDDLREEVPGRWRAVSGAWRWRDGLLEGSGKEGLSLALRSPVPDGLLVAFELLIHETPGYHASIAGVFLAREGERQTIRVELAPRGGYHTLRHHDEIVDYRKSDLAPGRWHRLEAALDRDLADVSVNGRPILRCNFLFPDPADRRSSFQLGGWGATARWRGLRIHRRPAATRDSVEERGDAELAAGRPEAAARLYARDASRRPDDRRLALKISACFRSMGATACERAWIARAASTPSPWATIARLGLRRHSGPASFDAELVRCLRRPQERSHAIAVAREEIIRAMDRGDHRRAYAIASILHEGVPVRGDPAYVVTGLIDALISGGRPIEAAREAARLAADADPESTAAAELALQEAGALMAAGKMARAAKRLARALGALAPDSTRWRARLVEAFLLRAGGKDREAMDSLGRIAGETPWPGVRVSALFHYDLMLELAGRRDAAERAAGRTKEWLSPHSATMDGFLRVLRGEYAAAARCILDEIRGHEDEAGAAVSVRPPALVAGVLLQIAEEEEGSVRVLEMVRRTGRRDDLESQIAGFYLGHGQREELDRSFARYGLTGWPVRRSVLLYLEGVRLEAKGDPEEASRYYRWAVREDPSRYWPTVLAERKLRYGRITKRAR